RSLAFPPFQVLELGPQRLQGPAGPSPRRVLGDAQRVGDLRIRAVLVVPQPQDALLFRGEPGQRLPDRAGPRWGLAPGVELVEDLLPPGLAEGRLRYAVLGLAGVPAHALAEDVQGDAHDPRQGAGPAVVERWEALQGAPGHLAEHVVGLGQQFVPAED